MSKDLITWLVVIISNYIKTLQNIYRIILQYISFLKKELYTFLFPIFDSYIKYLNLLFSHWHLKETFILYTGHYEYDYSLKQAITF